MSFQLRRLSEVERAEAEGLRRAVAVGSHEAPLEDAEVWGAFAGGLMLGFVAFRVGWIDQLHVRADRRRQGVGAALLTMAKESWPGLKVLVREDDAPSVRFYENRGFHLDGPLGQGALRYRWSEDD
jgi:ribosomal protein S18 acetylase RimI-like enzyme